MRVLFVGGGTLGSVTPLLAVAEELRRQSVIAPPELDTSREQRGTLECSFWGTRCGPERSLVESAGMLFHAIPAGKLRRYWDIWNILDLVVVMWALWVAFIRFMRWRPNVIIGAGSFVQVPVMWAAWVLRIPIAIHQLDVQPSFANRLVAPCAQHISAVFPVSVRAFGRKPVEVIGNPVRQSILAARRIESQTAKRRFGFRGDRPVLFVIGGGTGAQALNDLVWGALPQLLEYADVIHGAGPGKNVLAPPSPLSQGGEGKQEHGSPAPVGMRSDLSREAQKAKRESEQGNHYRSFDLLTDDLPFAYAAADLVVSRAGMGTITELGCLGKPMALVPMPGTHQEDNAAAMVDVGAAVIWHQRDLTPETFSDRALALVRDRAILGSLGHACVALFPADASVRLATAIIRLG